MLTQKITSERWFPWTVAILLATGMGLISYLAWVNIELQSDNTIAASELMIR